MQLMRVFAESSYLNSARLIAMETMCLKIMLWQSTSQ